MQETRAGSHGGPRSPGSQSALRHLNQQRLIDSLLAGPATQAELSRQTGLSTATVSNIVKFMQASGLVDTEPTTSSGRRALNVRLINDGAIGVGIDFGRRHLRVVFSSLTYQIIAEKTVILPLGHQGEEGIAAAARLVDDLLAEHDLQRSALIGAGVGIPGPIDRRSGTVAQGAILPEWVGLNLQERIEEVLDIPVIVDNDANLGALAEVTWGPHNGVDNLVFIKIGSGIGAGLIINGSPYYGNIGITGEIGHATVQQHGSICRCGNRGCLETVASTTIMSTLLAGGEHPPHTAEDIVTQGRAGGSAVLRVLDDAGMAVGQELGNIANLLNPEAIVVGGPLAGLGELLLDPIRRGLHRHAVPIVGESTNVVMSSLGERAESLGAAALAFQHVGIRAP
ncbi:MAG: ROK family transcriptional regulator [Arthrobacter sp.]|uniref:ROK family transcriptional regulator n=1 Tax=unclassified Arthrobacter TaxID=235627 RepID=UPI00264FB14C|nr:ROK family transcriptional regulator [Micrococcaceae bacterium]MDN5811448.1 ROK family transcriptional regulator [Micrococcaceae bacterium]MDN5823749.1 ROK family transcriptional regulator [Micrococcaceae bacterium]MDN5879030.1 ROK family transcriptional regulator [Micrococcaceae bacterium]MDN5885802.1 ROK family transcriptional regulator [Micrococcaceae bacterium]